MIGGPDLIGPDFCLFNLDVGSPWVSPHPPITNSSLSGTRTYLIKTAAVETNHLAQGMWVCARRVFEAQSIVACT